MKLNSRQTLAFYIKNIALVLSICALLGFVFSTTASAEPSANAYVRVVHAAPGAGNVDVFVDGTALLKSFAFGTVTDYVPLAAGSHKIQVAPAGKGVGAAVITQTAAVTAGVPYTLAALGTAASGFSLKAFVDNNSVAQGKAKVRVYHLSPNAGPVNVATGGKTVITGLTYPNASDYLTVPANTYTFNVTATQANATVPVSATLAAGSVGSVFAVGLYKGSPALRFVVKAAPGSH